MTNTDCKIQGLFKAFECFSITFKANFIFKDFSKQSGSGELKMDRNLHALVYY